VRELHRELREVDSRTERARLEGSDEAREARAELSRAREALEEKERELAARPTQEQVQALRQRLRVLQAVSLNAAEEAEETDAGWGDDEIDSAAAAPATPERGGAAPATLEALLLEKNRKMEHELTLARRAAADGAASLAEERKARAVAEVALAEQQQLVRQLEEDLDTGGGGGGGGGGAAAVASSLAATKANAGEQSKASTSGDAEAMVSVISKQRDRFRSKVLALEEELERQLEANRKLKSKEEATRADNLCLFEKVRYLESYPAAANGKERSAAGPNDVEEGGSAVVGRYRKLYEEQLNPFQEFRKKEQSSKDLRPHDRLMLVFGRILLGNQYSRAFLFFYTLALHMLVFAMLARASHNRSINPSQCEQLLTRSYLLSLNNQLFDSADADHNGVLSRAEMQQALMGS